MQKFQTENILLDLREVDIYAGLNIMILLLELHRYAQAKDGLKDNIVFYPCGKKDSDNFDSQRLLRIIGYSNCVTEGTFSATVGYFLSGTNLESANLSNASLKYAHLQYAHLESANLSFANLSGASLKYAHLKSINLSGGWLSGTNLPGSDLSGARLEYANLSEANLESANLLGADLSGADLAGASLQYADLSGANLSGARLQYADLSGAEFINIIWDEHTNWKDVRGLDEALNLPESLFNKANLTAQPSPSPNTPISA
jgi:uncharacterized protein YjbI with pentapeptide repeats